MSTKSQLLFRLKRAKGDWISGEFLSEGLSVSRSAVWKHIRKLREEGYLIQSSPKKGYFLEKTSDMLLPEEIREGIETRILGKKTIHHHMETASTNTTAKELAIHGAPEGTLIISEMQTGGKGRLGREWFSPPGEGIYLSFILRPSVSPAEAPKITLLAAVAVAEALRQATRLRALIKWPNDIILRGKKAAGILMEINTEMDAIDYVVIGLGVNVNIATFPAHLTEKATSLLIETAEKQSRVGLIKDFLQWFEHYYGMFQRSDFEPILERWRQLSRITGRRITVETIDSKLVGTAVDIDGDGRLMVEDNKGHVHRVYSGDVTLNGETE